MRRVLEYVSYLLMAYTVPLLPRFAMVWLGRRLGALYFLGNGKARRVGLENLRRAFPGRTDHRRILLNSMRLQGVVLLDALWSVRLSPERARSYVDFDSRHADLTRRLLERGRGVVLATAHFGSWEMFNLAGGTLGLPRATFIARPVRNRWIDRHLRRRRERTGNRLAYRREALPLCIGALRNNEIVCSVIDVAVLPSEGGLYVDLFGTPAMTSGALPMLAVKRRAPLLFAVCQPRNKGMSYKIEGVEIETRDAVHVDAEVLRLTAEMNRTLERFVREHPESWNWGYKRWKWQPSEIVGEYPSYALWVHPLW